MRALALILLGSLSIPAAPAAPAPPPPPASPPPAIPATAPAAPTTRIATAEMEPLLDGSIRYVPPPAADGWKLLGKTDDNKKASYELEGGKGRIDITVSPQTRDVPDTYARQMALIIGRGIRENADRAGRTILLQPRVEKDERFFLKIHDRLSGEHGISDRLQLYRVMGLNIVHVAVIALKDTPEEAAPIHATGENVLDGMRLTRGQAPVVYPRNKLKIKPPIDFDQQKTDAANGPVVTYTDPTQPSRQIIVRARVIPKAALDDPAKRDAFIDKMVDDERRTPPFSNTTKTVGDDQLIAGGAPREYLRQVRTDAVVEGGQKVRVQTRYFLVNDVMVSLRSVSSEDDEAILKLADAVALDVKPSRE
jgi:hypothetical protein